MKVFTINGPKLASLMFAMLCASVIVYVGFVNNQTVMVTAPVRQSVPLVLVVDSKASDEQIAQVLATAESKGHEVMLAKLDTTYGSYDVLGNLSYVRFVTLGELGELLNAD